MPAIPELACSPSLLASCPASRAARDQPAHPLPQPVLGYPPRAPGEQAFNSRMIFSASDWLTALGQSESSMYCSWLFNSRNQAGPTRIEPLSRPLIDVSG